LSETDPTAPLPPLRKKGPFTAIRAENLRKAREVRAANRSATPRTAADAQPAGPSMFDTPIPASRMPRDSGAFTPEYDGPTERISRVDRDTNQFELTPQVQQKLRNSGWSWAFKVMTVYNQPVDGTELLTAANAGWRAAKAKDFPTEVPPGTDPNGTVERFGQRLFIRPAHMTRQAQDEDYRFANAQMQSRMSATQEGKSVRSDEEGLADMGRIVRPVPIKLEMEGESGTHGPR
jgi:hypothetical protein